MTHPQSGETHCWNPRRGVLTAMRVCGAALLVAIATSTNAIAQEPVAGEEPAAERTGYLLQVPLPITGSVDEQVIKMIKKLRDRLLEANEGQPAGKERPILVLEFAPKEGQHGETSQFERSLAIARFLSSREVSGIRTVAYLPETIKGHAVLVAMACEEIIMEEDAELGQAGINEEFVEDTVRDNYRDIASRRGIFPTPFALGMLDPALTVYKVKVGDAVRYVLPDELERLEKAGEASDVETVTHAGELPMFNGRYLRQMRSVSHLVNGRKQLASVLRLPPYALEGDPSLGESWNAIKLLVEGPLQRNNVTLLIRGLRKVVSEQDVNFIIVAIDSEGGSPEDSLRLASELAKLDPSEVRTVAYIARQARADASIVALACDHIVMSENATVGGFGEAYQIPDDQQESLRLGIQEIAKTRQQDWSLMAALVDPKLVVHRYSRKRTGEVRYLCEAEYLVQEDPDTWLRGREIVTQQGLTGTQAESIRLARYLAGDYERLKQLYHLDTDPQLIEPGWAQRWTEKLAQKLADPMIAGWLLFAAMFFLSIEFSQPGLSAPGFLAAICFMLFFWSQYLHGTSGILEIMLFATGVVCLILEIFVIPGVGIFGIGGLLLVVISIILASQSFVIPSNTQELRQLPVSLSMVVAACGGCVAAIYVIRKFLPHTPYFNRMLLQPPHEQVEGLEERESLVSWGHLAGKRGKTTTQLTPSGKAKFGDDIVNVISEGDVIDRGEEIYVVKVQGNRVIVASVSADHPVV